MRKIYYSTKGYWKGEAAIQKLATTASVSTDSAKFYLEKQSIWQIYLPPPQYFPRPHFRISIPNQIHQADLLFLPHDIVKHRTFKYALVVVDIASRYVDAEALTSKESATVGSAFKKIYSRKLNWPETLMVDPGKEFMGSVSQLMKNNNVIIQRSEAGNHIAQAFVERANRAIGEKIFSHQYAQEMIREGRSREWVKLLPGIIENMNSTSSRVINKTPKSAIKSSESVHLPEKKYYRPIGFKEERLPPLVKVRYLYRAGEEVGGEKRRGTDAIWSLEIYELKKSIISPDQPILYFLLDGPKRGFVREQLQVVPADSELPPETVLK